MIVKRAGKDWLFYTMTLTMGCALCIPVLAGAGQELLGVGCIGALCVALLLTNGLQAMLFGLPRSWWRVMSWLFLPPLLVVLACTHTVLTSETKGTTLLGLGCTCGILMVGSCLFYAALLVLKKGRTNAPQA